MGLYLAFYFYFTKFAVINSMINNNKKVMKKFFSLLMVALMAACVLVSCKSNEEQAIAKLDDLLERVEKHADSMSQEDWEKVYSDYQAIGLDNEELQFTDEQREQVGQKTGQLLSAYAKHTGKNLGKEIKDAVKEGVGFLKGLIKGSDGE